MALKNLKKQTVGILGFGEVGKAIEANATKYYNVVRRDLNFDEFPESKIDILHICVPYTEAFLPSVIKTIKEVHPKLVIIDASVAPGTTRKIYKKTKATIVHCPIDGVHPNLDKYLTTFTKVVGAIDDVGFKLAKKHWQTLKIPKVVRFKGPEESELAKLLSTTYYGWNIIFNKLVFNLCKKTHTDFNEVYIIFNNIYNAGYKGTLDNVTRPVLKHVEGKIGGHCVIPNAEILFQMYKDPGCKTILDFNNSLKTPKNS